MLIKYVCLDDEAQKVEPIAKLLEEGNDDLHVEVRSPAPFDDEVRDLTTRKIDGLLLDLRLDRTANQDGKRVNYRALALAQELRTRMTEGGASFPIALWSVDDNFKQSYNKDETGHDLFDSLYYKGAGADNAQVANELVDLAEGYKEIVRVRSRTVKNIYSRLIDFKDTFDTLDPRIANELADNRSFPAHTFARSILQQLVLPAGPLVDEPIFAARLGVDIESSKDWEIIRAHFDSARYTGVFGTAWPRWWMVKVAEIWGVICPNAPLQRLQASERVECLKTAVRANRLTPAKPIEDHYDTRYWHVCRILNRPLAPSDAVQLSIERKEWQDGVFASLKAIIERLHKDAGLEIHAFERARINDLMTELRNARKTQLR